MQSLSKIVEGKENHMFLLVWNDPKDYGIFGCALKGFQGKSTGLVSVEMRFKTSPKQPISVMLVPEYSSCCIIDGDGNVSQSDY